MSSPTASTRSPLFGWWAAVTILLSAFLLFQVQPLISKAILPWFGGTPAVWTTCMLFFQVLLVGGYAYAHWITKLPDRRWQFAIHGVLLLLAATRFPVTPSDYWKPIDGTSPTFRILGLLAANVGLPYFVLATTGPLVQRWFGWVYPGRSPYRLYALSNVGSLAALLSYPVGIEPFLAVPQQGWIWSSLFVVFALLCGGMALWLGRQTGLETVAAPLPPSEPEAAPNKAPAKQQGKVKSKPAMAAGNKTAETPLLTRFLWVLLPAWASMAFLAVTNHLCQDVAVVPFLWVLPLSVYLLSFIICFDGERWYQPWFYAVGAMAFVVLLTVLTRVDFLDTFVDILQSKGYLENLTTRPSQMIERMAGIAGPNQLWSFVHWSIITFSLAILGAGAIAVRRYGRPEFLSRNTRMRNRLDAGFKVCVAFAFFSGLVIALNLLLLAFGHPFHAESFEDDIVGQSFLFLGTLFFICMLCHGELVRLKPPPEQLTGYYLRISLGGAFGGLFVGLVCPQIFVAYNELAIAITGGAALALMVLWNLGQRSWLAGRDVLSWGLLLVGMVFVTFIGLAHLPAPPAGQIAAARNFYGAVHIRHEHVGDKRKECVSLYNGRILHGQQLVNPDLRDRPTTYYSPDSGVGIAVTRLPRRDGVGLRVGVVGLGTGTMAAHGEEGDYYRFYEIDPKVVRLSRQYFSFTKDSPATVQIVLGDARIQMEKELREEGSQQFDLLVLDAFSSDAIPVHLITLEAMELYQKHLQADGIVAFHVSNRYLDLEALVYTLAKKFGYQTLEVTTAEGQEGGAAASTWVLLTNNQDFLNDGEVQAHAHPPQKDQPEILWTDKFSNLWKVLKK
jgi:hypothetical protein